LSIQTDGGQLAQPSPGRLVSRAQHARNAAELAGLEGIVDIVGLN